MAEQAEVGRCVVDQFCPNLAQKCTAGIMEPTAGSVDAVEALRRSAIKSSSFHVRPFTEIFLLTTSTVAISAAEGRIEG